VKEINHPIRVAQMTITGKVLRFLPAISNIVLKEIHSEEVSDHMEKQSLHKALIKLHEELSQTKSLDTVSKELLNTLLNDIHAILEPTADQTYPEEDNVLHRLKEATEHFEETHPQLTLALDNVLNALHRMGI